jgi:hypothetical protein
MQSKEAWAETSGRLQRGVHDIPYDPCLFKHLSIILLSFAQKEFDVVGPPVVMMLGRIRLFDYVGVFEDETSALLTPALTEESSLLSTVKPFQPIVSFF